METIDIKDLSWRYTNNKPDVLRNINIEVRSGEFLGIMGPTGAGKSTFALALRGVLFDFFEDGVVTGKASIKKVDVIRSSPQLFADRIGLVFQDASNQVLGTTVREDIAFGLCNLGLPVDEIISRIDHYIAKVRLTDKDWRSPATLSGGELQRLAIAGVLSMEPSVLVLDEPFAELDPRGKQELCELLDNLRNEKDITVVLIEQDMELIARYADRVAIFHKGEIVIYDKPCEAFRQLDKCIEIGVNPPEIIHLAVLMNARYGIVFNPLPLSAKEMCTQIKTMMRGSGKITDTEPNKPTLSENCVFRCQDLKVSSQELEQKSKQALIRIEDLSYVYPAAEANAPALIDVNMEIFRGEYIGLVGCNGAGKTTLTKHLNGMLSAIKGRVIYKGKDIPYKTTTILASEIGYCFQNPDHQIFEQSVFNEITYGLKNLDLDQKEIEVRVSNVLRLVGLSDYADEHPHNLGKGQRQKIALASIIVLEPEILVIDEPTTGLDWFESKKILNLIHELHSRGTTVIVVTHDMRIVREYATRIVVMSDGRIAFDGPPKSLASRQDVLKTAGISLGPIFELYQLLSEDLKFDNEYDLITVENMASVLANLLLKYHS